MSLHTAANRRATVAPRYMTRPYRMTPSRRAFVHGPLLGMDYPRARSTAWNIISLAVWAVVIAYAAKLWIVG